MSMHLHGGWLDEEPSYLTVFQQLCSFGEADALLPNRQPLLPAVDIPRLGT